MIWNFQWGQIIGIPEEGRENKTKPVVVSSGKLGVEILGIVQLVVII